jgi:4-hydroxy-3-polyprenylbenzoate decarboxylase
MGIDCTRKWPEEGFTRRWPDVIEMDLDVVDRVNKMWHKLGIGRKKVQ